jgi:hypothetical protein
VLLLQLLLVPYGAQEVPLHPTGSGKEAADLPPIEEE